MHLTLQQLSARLDDALQSASLQTVERHLAACEACRDELAALTMQDEVLSAVLRGDADDLLFELITLQVRCAIHPQKARELQKQVKTIELARTENRVRVETQALRDADARRAGLDNLEPGLGGEAVAADPGTARAAPTSGFEATDSRGGSVGHQRRAIGEAKVRAEAEARALALEARRARDEAESRALEQAGERARGGRDARRRREEEARLKAEARRHAEEEIRLRIEAEARARAEEEARMRLVVTARAEADALATTAAHALAEAESSAHDAALARARAEVRAAAADVARLEAESKAEEATRLAAGRPVRAESPPVNLASDPRPARHVQDAEDDLFLPATLAPRGAAVPPRGPRHRRSDPRRRRSSFPLTAAAAVLLAAFGGWFMIQHRDLFGAFVPAPSVEAVVQPEAGAPPSDNIEPTEPTARDLSSSPPAELPATVVSTEGGPGARVAAARHGAAVTRNSEPVIEAPSGEGTGAATVVPVTRRTSVAVTPSAPLFETGLLCGDVRDERGQPVAGARIMVADAGLAVVTDRSGRFCFAVPKGDHALSVLAIGFHTQRYDVVIGRQTSDLVITLHTASPAAGDSTQ